MAVILPGMRDPDDEDDDTPPPREDRLFGTGGFRRRLSEGLNGLLDPDGALGKGKDYVTGVTQATKTEVVRMVSAEVRNFLDGMDTVDLMQRVIAGLVIDVKAEIRFSIDPQGQLKSNITTRDTEIRSAEDKPRAESKPQEAAKAEVKKPETREVKTEARGEVKTEARSEVRDARPEPRDARPETRDARDARDARDVKAKPEKP